MRLLDAVLADAEIGQLEQGIVAIQILFGHRRDIADDMGGGLAEGIVAGKALLDRDAGQFEGVDVDPGHLVPIQIVAHNDGHETVLAPHVAHDAAAVAVGQRDQGPDRIERGREIVRLLADDDDAIGRLIGGELDAEAIDDPPARRRQEADADTVLIGQHAVAVGLQHLQIIHAARQRSQQAQLTAGQQDRPPGQQLAALFLGLHVRRAPARRDGSTPADRSRPGSRRRSAPSGTRWAECRAACGATS
jgi:hypothetical protein